MSNSGRRPTTDTETDILQFLTETDERVVTTPEVADAIGVSRRTALRHLSNLAEESRIRRKDVGGRSVVWWGPTIEKQTEAPAAPLRQLVGGLDAKAAADARERSTEWREEFNERLTSDST